LSVSAIKHLAAAVAVSKETARPSVSAADSWSMIIAEIGLPSVVDVDRIGGTAH
jgi:hypothetical protein